MPAYMPIRMHTPKAGAALIEELASAGIQARRRFYPALPAHPAYREFAPKGDLAAAFPVACDPLSLDCHKVEKKAYCHFNPVTG